MTRWVIPARPRDEAGRLPWWAWVPAILGAAFVVIPLVALTTRVEWAHLPALVTSPASLDALGLSLRTALASTLLCLLLGVPMALVLARSTSRGAPLVRAVVLLPLVLPPVVSGLALLLALGRRGMLGAQLDALGVRVGFTTLAVVLAQTFVSLPFLVVALEGAVRGVGTRYEEVAATLGASPGVVLRRVTLPLVTPGLASGTVLAFARALGEFGATLTFAGSLPGVTRTLPLEIYLQRETDPDTAVALSLVLLVVAATVVGAVHAGRPRPARRARSQHAPSPQGAADPRTAPEPRRPSPEDDQRVPPALVVDTDTAARASALRLTLVTDGATAVIGPNGAGKSTLVRLVAGLLRPDRGLVRIGDRVLVDTERGLWVPPHRRHVAVLGQDPLVLPHLTVRDNVAFGPRCHGRSRRDARLAADTWLRRLGVAHLAGRRGHELSGGQAQRVALARALAAEPDVLLLDEPLSALDVETAAQVRETLRTTLASSGARTVFVTHDLLDVAGLAHDVCVVEDGRVAEHGPVEEVLESPRSGFGASFVGLTLLRGRAVAADQVVLPDGTVVVGRGALEPGTPAVALWDPADVAVHVGPVTGSPRTVIRAVVVDLAAHHGAVRLRAETTSGARLAADVTPRAVAALDLHPGREVTLAVKAQSIRLLPAP